MSQHIRANLWLLALSVLICCVGYPVVLWAIGQTVFHDKANGSLVLDKSGTPIGSRIIAQPFSADEYFHPRPSSVGYNGAASGASNWGANNPALRKRVAASLGPILKYRDGRPVGPDIVTWVHTKLHEDPAVIAKWAEQDSTLADHWANSGSTVSDFLASWQKSRPEDIAGWQQNNPDAQISPKDVAALYFASFAKGDTKEWPETDGSDLQAAFFDAWWREHSDAAVQPVPADMVMTSGSGLDPDITLENARYQLDRVVAAWAAKTNQDASQIRQQIEKLLDAKVHSPLGGMVGKPLVNVLEMNLALRDQYAAQ